VPYKVLIVDDDVQFCNLLGRILSLEGYTVFRSYDLQGSSSVLKKESIDVVLLDANLPDGNGALFTKEISRLYPNIQTIILTGSADIRNCVISIKNGAIDYIIKGEEIDHIIKVITSHLLDFQKSDLLRLDQPEVKRPEVRFGFKNIIGDSEIIKDAVDLAKKVADTDAAVLLLGETGTGKELFAKAVHSGSSRHENPFIAINCSSFRKELLESELFGYRAGAFTGATKDKKGLLEEADGGTLFLDEIGEIDRELQSRMLRVLESGEYIKIGDNKVSHVNIRLISATNKNLSLEVKNGLFREDLFYRLNIFTVHLPPLRERKKDILLLADYFIKLFSQKLGKHITGTTLEYEKLLLNYPWKGNIRELKNSIERSIILSEGSILSEDTLPFEILSYRFEQDGNDHSPYDLTVFERQHIQKVLVSAKWNKAEAAKLLNISLSTLYRKIADYLLLTEDHN
jgi:two-component system, NtrC family, response regulator